MFMGGACGVYCAHGPNNVISVYIKESHFEFLGWSSQNYTLVDLMVAVPFYGATHYHVKWCLYHVITTDYAVLRLYLNVILF